MDAIFLFASALFASVQPLVKRHLGNAQGPAYTDDFENVRVAQIVCLPSADPKNLTDFIHGIRPFPYALAHAGLFCDQNRFLLPSSAGVRGMQCSCMIRYPRPTVNDMVFVVLKASIVKKWKTGTAMFQAADGTSAT